MNIFPSYQDVGFNPNDWTQELQEGDGTVEAGEYFNYWMTNWFASSLSTAPPLEGSGTSTGNTPTLPLPGSVDDLPGSTLSAANLENLVSMLKLQSNFSEQDIVLYLHQYMQTNGSSGLSPELLIAKGLGELMQYSLQIAPDYDLDNLWHSTRADLIQSLYPQTSIVVNAFKQQFINQGISEADANKLAEKAMVKMLDSQLEKAGGTVPSYGFGPKVGAAVSAMIAALLQGASNPAAFSTLINELGGLETDLNNFLATIPKTPPSQMGEINLNVFKSQSRAYLDGANELIDGMIATLNASNLNEEVKASFLEIMAFIQSMISMIQRLIVELAIQDLAASKTENQSKIDFALKKAETALKNAELALKGIEKQIKQKEKAEKKASTMQTVSIVLFVVAIVVVVVVVVVLCVVIVIIAIIALIVLLIIAVIIAVIIIVVAVVIGAVIGVCFFGFGVIVGAAIGLVVGAIIAVIFAIIFMVVMTIIVAVVAFVAAIIVAAVGSIVVGAATTFFALQQSGELDPTYDALFSLIMAIFRELFGSDMEVQDIAWVIIGIILAIVLVIILLILLVLIVAIVLLPILFVIACTIPCIAGFVFIVAIVVVVVAVVLVLILLLLLLLAVSFAVALIPELMLRAGFAALLAKWLAPKVNMDEEKLTLIMEMLFTAGSGSTTMYLTQDERNAKADLDLAGKGVGNLNAGIQKANIAFAEKDINRLSGMDAGGTYLTGVDRARENEEDRKIDQITALIEMLQKVIKHFQAVLAKILGGGGEAVNDISEIAGELQTAMEDWGEMVSPEQAAQLPDLTKIFEAIFGQLAANMAQAMPTIEMVKQMKKNYDLNYDPNAPGELDKKPNVVVPV